MGGRRLPALMYSGLSNGFVSQNREPKADRSEITAGPGGAGHDADSRSVLGGLYRSC